MPNSKRILSNKNNGATLDFQSQLRAAADKLHEGGLQVYTAASKDNKGSSSLTLSSLEVTSTAADGGKVYAPHDSAQAQLIGLSGAEQISISF